MKYFVVAAMFGVPPGSTGRTMNGMGTFDTIIDELTDREIQVKCFGKGLRALNVGDAVRLYRQLDADALDALSAEIAAGPHETLEIGEQTIRLPRHERFMDLINGVITDLTDYQVILTDGTYLTVTGGILTGIGDPRDDTLRRVDNHGGDSDGNPRHGGWVTGTDPDQT